MDQQKIDRINYLANKSKAEPLSDEEKEEQASLRAEYISEFRSNMRGILDNTYIQRPDGTKEKIKRK